MFFQIFQHDFGLFFSYNFQAGFVKKHPWSLFRQEKYIAYHYFFRQCSELFFKICTVVTALVKYSEPPVLQNNTASKKGDNEQLPDFYRILHFGKSTETQKHQQRHDANVVACAEGQSNVKTGQQRRYGKNKYRDRSGHKTYMRIFITP